MSSSHGKLLELRLWSSGLFATFLVAVATRLPSVECYSTMVQGFERSGSQETWGFWVVGLQGLTFGLTGFRVEGVGLRAWVSKPRVFLLQV